MLRARFPRAILLSGLALTLGSSCASHHDEETVTIDANRMAFPGGPEPIAVMPQLPARDPDVEKAGDRVAGAITLLNANKRRGPAPWRSTAASRDIDQAGYSLGRALKEHNYPDEVRDALHSAIRDLIAAQKTINRGANEEALRELDVIDKKLDALEVSSGNKEAEANQNQAG